MSGYPAVYIRNFSLEYHIYCGSTYIMSLPLEISLYSDSCSHYYIQIP